MKWVDKTVEIVFINWYAQACHSCISEDFSTSWGNVRKFVVFNSFVTVCYYHVTYAFQSESTLYSCLNVKELLARNRRDIWSLSDSSGIWTHNHLGVLVNCVLVQKEYAFPMEHNHTVSQYFENRNIAELVSFSCEMKLRFSF